MKFAAVNMLHVAPAQTTRALALTLIRRAPGRELVSYPEPHLTQAPGPGWQRRGRRYFPAGATNHLSEVGSNQIDGMQPATPMEPHAHDCAEAVHMQGRPLRHAT